VRLVALVALVALAGCANENIKGKASLGLNYAIPSSTDYWQHSDRPWQCEQPQLEGKAGWEHRNGWGWGGYHESMVLCGNWNGKAEIYENGLYLEKTWGGWNHWNTEQWE